MNRSNIKCDVLIVGGGIAGLANAVSIKERMPEADVLVIEKNFAGYAGKANRGGGVLQYFDPEKVKSEDFLAFHVNEVGCFLGQQELMMKYVQMNPMLMDKLAEWGVVIPREENGEYRRDNGVGQTLNGHGVGFGSADLSQPLLEFGNGNSGN